MLKKKLVAALLALFAVAAVTAASAATASAAFTLSSEPCGGNSPVVHNLCWNTTKVLAELEPLELTGIEEIKAVGGPILFNVPSIPVEILCEKIESTTTIDQSTVLGPLAKNSTIKGFILFMECSLEGTGTVATKCVIPVEEPSNELKSEAISNTAVLLEPASGTVFVEINFTSKAGQTCPATVIGLRKVTGKEEVTTSEAPEEGQKVGESVVKSELLFIEKASELTGSITVSLVNAKLDWVRLAES
jgi:hypothetical protein